MTALILLAPGFEEIEALTLVDVLRRAGVRVTTAGIVPDLVESVRGVKVLPDTLLERVSAEDFDLIALPGGQPGSNHLKADLRVLDLLKAFDAQKKWIAAICAAPMVLGAAGLLNKKRFTCYPGCETDLTQGIYETDSVVEDGKILTSRGPATALPFALKLAEKLAGKEISEKISKDMLAKF